MIHFLIYQKVDRKQMKYNLSKLQANIHETYIAKSFIPSLTIQHIYIDLQIYINFEGRFINRDNRKQDLRRFQERIQTFIKLYGGKSDAIIG